MLDRTETPTLVNEGQAAVIQRLIETGKSIVPEGCKIAALGVAAPGPLDAEEGIIIHARTLPGWSNVPLGALLSAAFDGVPAHIQNDANLAALAEYHLGAGRGADPMIYLTISTGIGGGAVIDGKLFTGHAALAIEPGHMRFTQPDGSHLRLEELASGTAIGLRARKYLDESSVASILREVAVVDGQAVGAAAVQGDQVALRVVNEAGQWLGLGLVNLIHLFNPQAIVLGGSVMQLGDLLLKPAIGVIRETVLYEKFYSEDLIRSAAIADDVCLVGGALHAANRTSRKPSI